MNRPMTHTRYPCISLLAPSLPESLSVNYTHFVKWFFLSIIPP